MDLGYLDRSNGRPLTSDSLLPRSGRTFRVGVDVMAAEGNRTILTGSLAFAGRPGVIGSGMQFRKPSRRFAGRSVRPHPSPNRSSRLGPTLKSQHQ